MTFINLERYSSSVIDLPVSLPCSEAATGWLAMFDLLCLRPTPQVQHLTTWRIFCRKKMKNTSSRTHHRKWTQWLACDFYLVVSNDRFRTSKIGENGLTNGQRCCNAPWTWCHETSDRLINFQHHI